MRKVVTGLCACVLILGCAATAPEAAIDRYGAVVAEAAATAAVTKPVLKLGNIYSNKIELKVDNLSAYSSDTIFGFYVNGNYVKRYKYSTLANKNLVSLFDCGRKNLSANTSYTVQCMVESGGKRIMTDPMTISTTEVTSYKINAGAPVYKLSGSKMTKTGTVSKVTYAKAVLVTDSGKAIAGLDPKQYKGTYIKLNEGTYKGKYVKVDDNVCRVTERTAKVQKVIQYAVGMNGGRYVWGGASYAACDCSGLTMLAYKQVGIDITHSTWVQATKGKANTLANIKPGDVIICNNYGHAALYIGDGKIIHAMNSYYGIRIQTIDKLRYCGRVNAVRTII